MAENSGFTEMKCINCDATLELDLDNLQKFCPYCGSKILVEPAVFQEILAEREETKRLEMKYKQEEKLQAMKDAEERRGGDQLFMLVLIPLLAFIVFALLIILRS